MKTKSIDITYNISLTQSEMEFLTSCLFDVAFAYSIKEDKMQEESATGYTTGFWADKQKRAEEFHRSLKNIMV